MWSRGSMGIVLGALAAACAVGAGTRATGGDNVDAGPGAGGAGGVEAGGGTGGIPAIDAASDAPQAGHPCDPDNPVPSYVGCDFWPTVTTNGVWEIFDFAVVVANAGTETAKIEITKDSAVIAEGEVPPNELGKFFLPWVPELKSGEGNICATIASTQESVHVPGGAYHLKSSEPVTVYQFNPLQYQGSGGPEGKSWAACPGLLPCFTNDDQPMGCFSFTNDASLLLPSTAWTGSYRVGGQKNGYNQGNFIAITAADDDTTVQLKLSATGVVESGAGVLKAGPNQSSSFVLDRGDVVQLIGSPGSDFSGSLIQSDKPVQVISGVRCTQEPLGTPACDHVEETVLPAESLGKRYFVASPTGARGNVVGHRVRIYGNVDGTSLSYPSGAPVGAPATIDAGDVVDLESVSQDFEIVGSEPFLVGSFMLGGKLQDPPTSAGDEDYLGDPSQSFMVPVEQFRKRYVFLAPDDYDVSFVDVLMPLDASVTIDGEPAAAPTPIGKEYGIVRAKLGPGKQGAHVLEATEPVGIQVMGYGSYTSYHYPGGADLERISVPPVR